MAQPIIIAKNQTASPIVLRALGVTVPALGQLDLCGTANASSSYYECTLDPDLEDAVSMGSLVLNDGTNDLPADEALVYLNASGSFNGPPATGLSANTLLKLRDNTGRFASPTNVTIDANDNLSTPGALRAASIEVAGSPLSLDDLSNVNFSQAPTVDDGLVYADGSVFVPLKNQVAASDPAVTNDKSQGFRIGSRWWNTATDTEWVCVDASIEAAVWKATTETPTSNDEVRVTGADTTPGYLLDKLVSTSPAINLSVENPGANEVYRLDVASASVSAEGVIELATQAEVNTGTDATRAVTPATLRSASTVVKPGDPAGGGLSGTYPNPTVTPPFYDIVTEPATNPDSTTSTTHVPSAGMVLTPPAGTYLVRWWANARINANNDDAFLQIYAGGTPQGIEFRAEAGRVFGGNSGSWAVVAEAKVTVNGAQAIEGRFRQSGGTTVTLYSRALSVLKVS